MCNNGKTYTNKNYIWHKHENIKNLKSTKILDNICTYSN